MFFIKLVAGVCLLCTAQSKDNQWVWEDNGRNSKTAKSRYEVVEDDVAPFVQENYRPSNLDFYNEGIPERPYKPVYQRPGGVYGDNPAISGGYGQGAYNNPEILTGPVPSWVPQSPIKDFDKCKCSEKFNCPTTGISYGHCDVGKQYCCYVSKAQNVHGRPIPSRPIHSAENGILVGPGGPVDYPGPHRPHYTRPGGAYGNNGNGILTGPGRPTGIIGRPHNNYGLGRPTYSGQNGVLVGPGGPYDSPYRPPGPGGNGYGIYARSSDKKNT